jgi:hypothetical protein
VFLIHELKKGEERGIKSKDNKHGLLSLDHEEAKPHENLTIKNRNDIKTRKTNNKSLLLSYDSLCLPEAKQHKICKR